MESTVTGTTEESIDLMALFKPPVQRSASVVLDRALFSKTISISAARITDNRLISKCRSQLEKTKELLSLERIANVRKDPDASLAAKGTKCLLLKPDVKPNDPASWSPILQEAVKAQEVGVIPYDLKLDYNYWTYFDIMTAILPEDAQDEIPVGFSVVGHIAHLNLRSQYLPYRHLIAEVLIDKNPGVKTVINKIDLVGEVSEFRTFRYEVLAGPDDLNVEVKEEDCIFRFDYSKVYWNSRLNTEHKRLVDMFQPGQVVCDVMAGVGPFAVPAGKKGVFVWANDLNPASYESMKDSIARNKVSLFVRPFNQDGHAFIKNTTNELLHLHAMNENSITIRPKKSRTPNPAKAPPTPTIITIPQTVSHFVMNLPATAISFLPSFSGLYANHETLFCPHTSTKLPMIHVHCFSTKSDDNVQEGIDISQRISKELGVEIRPGDGEVEGTFKMYDVRDVAPQKRMFCASFRLPEDVAFRKSLYGSTHLAQGFAAANANVQGMFINDIVGSPIGDDGKNTSGTIRLFAQGIPSNENAAMAKTRLSIGGEIDSPARELGRFTRDVRSNSVTGMSIEVIRRADRYLRGGDHEPFLAEEYPAG